MADFCIDGESCSIHYRVDQLELEDTTEKLVSYVGEYAVVTEVAPEVVTRGAQIAMMLGYLKPDNMYLTTVGYLGSKEASLHDSKDAVTDQDFYRYWIRHNDTENLLTAHLMVVDGVSNGVIDTSEAKGAEYTAETLGLADKYRQTAISNMNAI